MQQIVKQDKIESTAINYAIRRNPEIHSYTTASPVNWPSSMSASEEEEPAEDNENFEEEDSPEEEEFEEEEQ